MAAPAGSSSLPDTSEYKAVTAWLSEVFVGEGSAAAATSGRPKARRALPVPEVPLDAASVSLLHRVVVLHRRRTASARALTAHMRDVESQYFQESARLSRELAAVGVAPDALSAAPSMQLDELASAASHLGVASASASALAAALSALGKRHRTAQAAKERLRREAHQLVAVLSSSHALADGVDRCARVGGHAVRHSVAVDLCWCACVVACSHTCVIAPCAFMRACLCDFRALLRHVIQHHCGGTPRASASRERAGATVVARHGRRTGENGRQDGELLPRTSGVAGRGVCCI